ncbi:glutamate-1-semialdehyde 2,1-aminomutase [Crocinitomicaceae bacterium]|jgi:glutamate-1-semialdehyde 2,1-aminomutase|nr:glutamate-1-semialdehyde 2,1-aminomutase [Crocinitomicaceae bacterium]
MNTNTERSTEESKKLFELAKKVIPGGVNSPVRAFKSVGGSPIFIESAKGAYLYDADGNRYIDYIASWGPMILGHAHEEVIDAVAKTAVKGTSFGIPTELETKIAVLATQMAPNIDQIRFVNSGTEACMSAVRLARGFTGKEKLIKFSGCYHGHADPFLIEAGSGAMTFGTPNSPGVTKGTAKDTLLARYNNLESVQELFSANDGQIAAVIIEPVAGNMGCIPPKEGFLEGIKELCNQHDALFIFDEVMTGFRLSTGGAQQFLGIDADIVTYGKVIGGGLPVGAFGARKEIMSFLAPEGPVYQAGTLSGNPLAMTAGFSTLQILQRDPKLYERLSDKTKHLSEMMRAELKEKGIGFQLNQLGSMMSLHFCEQEVVDFETSSHGNNEMFKKYFHFMLNQGIYLPPSAYESYFLNDALSYADLDDTAQIFRSFLKTI